jgi:hypothetical protein
VGQEVWVVDEGVMPSSISMEVSGSIFDTRLSLTTHYPT